MEFVADGAVVCEDENAGAGVEAGIHESAVEKDEGLAAAGDSGDELGAVGW